MENKEKIKDLLERGVENVIPSKEKLEEVLKGDKKLNVYLGIDPTATRIHLGHAVLLRKLQRLVELGHKVTFLIGDFTAKIGDTSDKEGERPVLTDKEIKKNFETYKEQASRVLDFDGVEVRHNSEWLGKLTFADVLDIAGYFSVNDFVSRDLVRKRLKEGKRVSLPETLYPLMQGYDSYYLDIDIQVGGTDQTFNMQAGRKLQKMKRNKESFVLASGFLPGTDGRKMSKSWGNAIWLSDAPEEIYGKVMSLSDEVMRDYWVMATEVSISEIDEKMKRVKERPMEIKKELAAQIVEELYGEQEAKKAGEHFESVVVDKGMPADVDEVIVEGELDVNSLLAVLVEKKVVESKAQAKRLLEQGAIRVNDEKLGEKLSLRKGENVVRVGKRRYLKVVA